MSYSLWFHGLQPARLLCLWNFPGNNTRVGYYFLLQKIFLTQGSNLCLCFHTHDRCCFEFFSCNVFNWLLKWDNASFIEWFGECWFICNFWKCLRIQFSHLVVADSLRRMDCCKPGFPVHHQLLELVQTQVHWVSDAIQQAHLLSSPSNLAFNLSHHWDLFQ